MDEGRYSVNAMQVIITQQNWDAARNMGGREIEKKRNNSHRENAIKRHRLDSFDLKEGYEGECQGSYGHCGCHLNPLVVLFDRPPLEEQKVDAEQMLELLQSALQRMVAVVGELSVMPILFLVEIKMCWFFLS